MVRFRRLMLLASALWLVVAGWGDGPGAGAQQVPARDSSPSQLPEPPKIPPRGEGEAPARTRTTAGRTGSAPVVGRGSIVQLFARANPMVWLLALCSVVTIGYVLERLLALRRQRVIPRDFVQRFLERLSGGKLDRDRAAELCRANDSPVARVFAMIVGYWGQPAATIRQAIGHDAAGELLDLKRNVRVLNGTATLAPLLGLLGTVIGMIQSFEALGGHVGPGRAEALAQGISLALVTTAFGLGIAVISVAAYYFFLNRVDVLVRDLDEQARRVIDLVSNEAIRPMPTDRRTGPVPPPTDHVIRHETRVHG
jgi:biopolymer transport protein ExbB